MPAAVAAAFAARTGCLFIGASAKMAAGVTEAFNDVVVRIIYTPSLWREEKSKSSPKNAGGAASGFADTTYLIARRLEHAGEYRTVPGAGRGHVTCLLGVCVSCAEVFVIQPSLVVCYPYCQRSLVFWPQEGAIS